jgi:type IV pilus assembly protein PilA
MKTLNRSSKGFTLVEIMIVVVIIGLLAAMAIPAFQKVRRSSLAKTVLNDARQVGAAAQQYMMENGVTSVSFSYTAATGAVGGPLTDWVKQISKNYTIADAAIEATNTAAFSWSLPGAFGGVAQTFDAEGKRTSTDAE